MCTFKCSAGCFLLCFYVRLHQLSQTHIIPVWYETTKYLSNQRNQAGSVESFIIHTTATPDGQNTQTSNNWTLGGGDDFTVDLKVPPFWLYFWPSVTSSFIWPHYCQTSQYEHRRPTGWIRTCILEMIPFNDRVAKTVSITSESRATWFYRTGLENALGPIDQWFCHRLCVLLENDMNVHLAQQSTPGFTKPILFTHAAN